MTVAVVKVAVAFIVEVAFVVLVVRPVIVATAVVVVPLVVAIPLPPSIVVAIIVVVVPAPALAALGIPVTTLIFSLPPANFLTPNAAPRSVMFVGAVQRVGVVGIRVGADAVGVDGGEGVVVDGMGEGEVMGEEEGEEGEETKGMTIVNPEPSPPGKVSVSISFPPSSKLELVLAALVDIVKGGIEVTVTVVTSITVDIDVSEGSSESVTKTGTRSIWVSVVGGGVVVVVVVVVSVDVSMSVRVGGGEVGGSSRGVITGAVDVDGDADSSVRGGKVELRLDPRVVESTAVDETREDGYDDEEPATLTTCDVNPVPSTSTSDVGETQDCGTPEVVEEVPSSPVIVILPPPPAHKSSSIGIPFTPAVLQQEQAKWKTVKKARTRAWGKVS